MFISLLVTAAWSVSVVAASVVRPFRLAGPAVKRWSGWVLVATGGWFAVLAVLPDPTIAA